MAHPVMEMLPWKSSSKLIVVIIFMITTIIMIEANPAIDVFPKQFVYTKLYGICIRNCAQCKKMFGPYFEGQLCADACVKFKGKIIPDCEDLASISPFLNKFE